MTNIESYSTWAVVDLGTIRKNVALLREISGVQVMAVVKANAYGHGMVPVAQAALEAGATWCGVARLEEALELRSAGIDSPILLLGYTPIDRFGEAIARRVSLAVWNNEQVMAAAAAARQVGDVARLHLKVDTGMGRLGVLPHEVLQFCHEMVAIPEIRFEGIFTHFARADEIDRKPTDRQEDLLREVLDALEASGLRPPVVHAANSAASLSRPSATFDLIRAGVAIYGLHPSGQCPLPSGFEPALSWKATLSQIKVLPAGKGISYGHTYITRKEERIGTVAVGYADGYRRWEGNEVLIGGRPVPVVGRVCMDQIMVQLDGIPDSHSGDEVVLIGQQGDYRHTAEDLAAGWGTINYEVTSGIAARVPRIYR